MSLAVSPFRPFARVARFAHSQLLALNLEDEDSLPDVAFAVEGRELCGQRSRDDEDDYEYRLSRLA